MLWSVVAVVAGAIVWRGWAQPAPSVAVAVTRLRGGPHGAGRVVSPLQQLQAGAFAVDPVMLRLIESTAQRYAIGVLRSGAVGSMCGATVGAVAAISAIVVPLMVPLFAVVGTVVAAALFHSRALGRAAEARRAIRHELSAYLDVVAMMLAGDSGHEGALREGAEAGDGLLFVELRRRIREATQTGRSLVDALEQTGEWFGVTEIVQVASTLTISSAEGAPVARSLAATCASLRSALASEQETEARLRTGRLTLPLVLMALIFMAVVIYPALGG
jgi:Flp pilus assembly protein TadB